MKPAAARPTLPALALAGAVACAAPWGFAQSAAAQSPAPRTASAQTASTNTAADAAPPAAAPGGADCAPVLQALSALGAAPRYHWTLSARTPARRRPFEREQIVLGDLVYATPDNGRWMKNRVTADERAARMADELARHPPERCRAEPSETRDGTPMRVYAYNQGAAEKRIWVGAEDGLPHALTSSEGPVSVTTRVDYDDVSAPLH